MEAQKPHRPAPSLQRRCLHRCPVCRRPIVFFGDEIRKRSKFFPFCSERCKLVDLGAWLDGDYRMPTRPEDASDEQPLEDMST